MTVRFGTFDAESWWRPGELAALPTVGGADPAVWTMDELLAGFCGPGDLLLTRRPLDPALLDGLVSGLGVEFGQRAVGNDPGPGPVEDHLAADPVLADVVRSGDPAPYAVLPSITRLVDTGTLPDPATVALVNSKTWSNQLVESLGLPGAGRVVRSVDDLVAAVTELEFRALVKDPYGVSGRALLEAGTPGVLRAVERVLRRQVERGARVELLVQEKYQKAHDFSAHLTLARDGSWKFLGLQYLRNKGFRHLGSGPAPTGLVDLDRYAADVLTPVASALTDAGYWGPVGIDAMVLADGRTVPLLEINARQSLGLLALRFDRQARAEGLTGHLWQLELNLDPGNGIADVLTALHGVRRSSGSGPGAVVLSGSHLTAPGGRVYVAICCRAGELDDWQQRLLAAVTSAGLTPRGITDAA